jgi:CBF1 interacting corepressor
MVAGLKFLSKKGFNPQNRSNQQRVWEAEQRASTQHRLEREREAQLQRERDEDDIFTAHGEEPSRLRFIYQAPPGFRIENRKEKEEESTQQLSPAGNPKVLSSEKAELQNQDDFIGVAVTRQPGDDDAAAAFRLLLANHASADENISSSPTLPAHAVTIRGLTFQGSTYTPAVGPAGGATDQQEQEKRRQQSLSALERAAGKVITSDGKSLSLNEQTQRFPALANAPRVKGMTDSHVGLSFKPLGATIRNVRCMACGTWGHAKGDRECQVTGWDPFAAPTIINKGTGEVMQTKKLEMSRVHESPSKHDTKHEKKAQSKASEVSLLGQRESTLDSHRSLYDERGSSDGHRRRHKAHHHSRKESAHANKEWEDLKQEKRHKVKKHSEDRSGAYHVSKKRRRND